MGDKETNYRSVIKFTQVDSEWIAFHSKGGSRVRTKKKKRHIETHTDVRQECQEK